MKKYEYKFVEIQRETGLKVKTGDTFEKCKQVISKEAEQGWKLVQVVTPFNEKAGVCPLCIKIGHYFQKTPPDGWCLQDG